MNELLTYVVAHLSFLYNEYGARFVDSKAHGADAMLILEAEGLRIRLVRDRGQIFFDVQSDETRSELRWYSFDLIRHLLTGKIVDDSVMDDVKPQLIRDRFPEIVDAFSPNRRRETEKTLEEYKRARAKRMFG